MSHRPDHKTTVAQRSARGVAIITLAKAYFLVTGFVQPLLLTRLLGQTGYGVYGSVLNTVSIVNNVVVAGSIQAMSRCVTEAGSSALRRGLVLHVLLGMIVAAGLVFGAEPLGAKLLGDPQLPPLLRVAAIVAGNYSVYAALVGALNGQQRFRAQAGLDITFATLRTVLVIGLAATVWKVAGAVAGFAVASGVIILVAFFTVTRTAPLSTGQDEPFTNFVRRYVRFFAPVLFYQLALNLVMQVDLLVLKGLLVRRPGISLDRVNELVGIYKAVQNFAFLPYQLLLAVTFVAFPIVSRATLENDRETARTFVRGTLRFSAMALGAMLAVLTGLSSGVLRLAYRPEMAVGAGALRVLSVGQGAFALAVIACTIVLAAGRTAAATGCMWAMLAAVLVGDAVAITWAPVGVTSLQAAAIGTTLGCASGLVVVAVYLRRMYGAFVPGSTLRRVVLATVAAAVLVGAIPSQGKPITLVLAVVAAVVYGAVLILTGEIGPEERAAIRRTIARRMRREA